MESSGKGRGRERENIDKDKETRFQCDPSMEFPTQETLELIQPEMVDKPFHTTVSVSCQLHFQTCPPGEGL